MISGDRSIPEARRGAFWYTLEELKQYFERVDVICPKPKNSCLSGVVHAFDRVYIHHSSRGLWRQPWWILKKGRELCGERQYRVMTVHDYPPFYNGLGAWMLQRKTGIPYIEEIHHVVGYPRAADFGEWIGRRMYWLFFQTIGKRATAVRVVNQEVEHMVQEWTGKDHVRLLSSQYLDRKSLQPDSSIKKKYDLIFCGRLVKNKGVENVLNVLVYLHKVSLLIVGDGSLFSKLKAQSSKLGLDGRVTFTRWLPEKNDVYRAIQSAKVMVVPSKSEGGPRVALEAMALGVPLIATRVGVLKELEKGKMYLPTTGEIEDLKEKIELMLFDQALYNEYARRGRDVLTMYCGEKLIKEYAKFLKSIA